MRVIDGGLSDSDYMFFQQCRRCGIEFGVKPNSKDEFCIDCDYLDHTGVFEPLDPWWLLEGEE